MHRSPSARGSFRQPRAAAGLTAALLALAAAQPATAQPAPASPARPAPGHSAAPVSAAPAPSDVAARSLARIAMIDARVPLAVETADFAVAAEVLEVALSLAPDDAELLRLLIEARDAAGDADRAAELRRRLIALDPADAVSTLAVIADRIGRLQDLDARLAAYEQLLGDRGTALDDSIRSRLALDAAVLLRERGDADGFASRLRLALKLDSTNKDAASLLYAFLTQADSTPAQRLEALALLLLADPVDGQTHVLIAGELAAAGAYAPARRFYQLASSLAELLDGAKDPAVESALEIARWRLEGPAATAQRLDTLVRRPREDLSRRLAALSAQRTEAAAKGLPAPAQPDTLPKPEDIRLPPQLERVFALAALAAGDAPLTERALAELKESLRRAEELVTNPAARAQGTTEEQARQDLPAARLEFAWAALLANQLIPDAATVVDQLIADGTLRDAARLTLEGWLALRTGVTAAALPKLTEAAADSPAARLGLAVLAEERSDRAAALEGYRFVADAVPDGPMGAFAASAYQRLAGQPLPVAPAAAPLAAMADGVPRWIDDLVQDNRRFIRLGVAPSRSNVSAAERLTLSVKLRNTAPAPLALGPELAINSRLLIAPKIEIGANPMGNALPNVASLARRFRLRPGEEFEVSLWPDGGLAGWFMELGAGQTVRASYRVLLGFRPRESGGYEVGPLGLGGDSGPVTRTAFPNPSVAIPDLTAAFPSATHAQLVDLLGVVRYRLYRDHRGFERLPAEQRQALVAAILDAYTRADTPARLLFLAMLPTAQFISALAPFDEAVLADAAAEPRVAIVALASRVIAADHPALQAAAASADPALRRAAERVRARLADPDRRTFSRLSGGVAAQLAEPAANPDGSPARPDAGSPARPAAGAPPRR